MPLQATSGAASYDAFGGGAAAVPNYIEDVMSTFLYTGNGSTQTITNGIDLAGEGGLVWLKDRNSGFSLSHGLTDTVRGFDKLLSSNATFAQITLTNLCITGFNTDGFGLGTNSNWNNNGTAFASWTFRKQPKFFDVVTYTGDGVSGRAIAHSLGTAPGCMIVKRIDSTSAWFTWHRAYTYLNGTAPSSASVGALNTTAALAGGYTTAAYFPTLPTATDFYVGSSAANNIVGATYVAYLFAHNAGGFGLSGTDNVISCGSYTGNGSATGPTITLGYEPQWLMVKNASGTGNWQIIDNMRGMPVGSADATLQANLSNAESSVDYVSPTATGFQVVTTNAEVNTNASTYIYIAIRRGPMKVPTTGTSVFYPQTISQADNIDSTGVPFPPDLVNTFSRNGTYRSVVFNQFQFVDRLRGLGTPSNFHAVANEGLGLVSSSTGAEYGRATNGTYVQLKADGQNITRSIGWNSSVYGNWIYYFMRRAPGFFDVVCYTGTGVARTVAHNLAAVPELMIVKCRSSSASWLVYSAATGSGWYLVLNTTREKAEDTAVWNNTTPTASVFSLGNAWVEANQSGQTYVAYLFASCPGVSKAGGYTGTGTTQTINCGFTGGARYVLIKATSTTGDWYVWDSARGIVPANDPYLRLNSAAAEVTNTDWLDTAATGFELSNAAGNLANSNGVSYIFLAVA